MAARGAGAARSQLVAGLTRRQFWVSGAIAAGAVLIVALGGPVWAHVSQAARLAWVDYARFALMVIWLVLMVLAFRDSRKSKALLREVTALRLRAGALHEEATMYRDEWRSHATRAAREGSYYIPDIEPDGPEVWMRGYLDQINQQYAQRNREGRS